ncbi:LysR family transcriptional regulator [Streptomyces sulphureus]|uniref:LysR family transcriptional regulator n=1 Tax=Streptomyces sulphureus TaxID=47758 RepID=UPI00036FD951|nr:LysR family transcriptional regulator [Streptomyces sulphureus]
MELELRHLRLVHAIADAGSLTRAATSLGLAQSALSGQLKRIERTLGGPLFDRGRTGARPTPLGQFVLDRSRVLLPAVHRLQDDAARFTASFDTAPRFRIGATHGPLLGGLVDRLAAARPHTPLSTRTSWSVTELSAMAATGRLDYVLVGVCGDSPPPAGDGLAWREIGEDPVFAMVPETHPLAAERELELGTLAGEWWVCAPGDGCFADCFAAACARAGFTPAALHEADVVSCTHLVRVGRAVGLCRATFAPTPGVVTVPLAGNPLRWRHLLGWHPESAAADAAPSVTYQARRAHREAAARNPAYVRWLAERRHGARGTGLDAAAG